MLSSCSAGYVTLEEYGYVSIYYTFENEGGLYTAEGRELLPPKYYNLRIWGEKLVQVAQKDAAGNAHYGVMDLESGKTLTPMIWDDMGSLSDGTYLVRRNGLYGYLGSDFREIITARYEEATDFSDGCAAVKINGEWHIIDKSGTVLY